MSENAELKGDTRRLYCNHCKCETNHVMRGEHCRRDDEVEGSHLVFFEEYVHRLWICAGCDTGTLEEAWTCSGQCDHEGKQIYESRYYPSRASDHLLARRYKQLPENLGRIYVECIESFNTGLRLLCAAGLRALIEGICQDKNLSGRNLEIKINSLNALLPENIVESLHVFRFMGNEAMHELAPSSGETLRVAIEVCEDLLNFLYELDYKAQQLPRKKKEDQFNK